MFLSFNILIMTIADLLSLSPLGFPKAAYFHLSKYSGPVFIFTQFVLEAHHGSSTLGMLL